MNRKIFAVPYWIWVLGFTIIPLIFMGKLAFTDSAGAFTFENILAIFSPIHRKSLILSLEIAAVCTGICILLSYPLALVLKSLNFSRKSFVIIVMVLPMWMNFILRILAVQMLISQNGIINSILSFLHLGNLNIINTPAAIVLGMVYDFLPFMIMPIYNSVMGINEDLIEAAQDLGANSFHVFWRVMFPLTIPGMLSGITMVFVPAMTSFVIADILGGGKVQLLGNIIEQEFNISMNWNLGAGLSIALMAFVAISMLFSKNDDSDEKESILW